MGVLRWTVKIHKWIALIIGLQIAIWITGGIVMSVIPIEQVRGEHKIAELSRAPFDPTQIVSLEQAVQNADLTAIKEANLGSLMGRPVWRLIKVGETDPSVMIDGRTGKVLTPVSESLAAQIAIADYNGKGNFEDVKRIDVPPPEYGRPGPVWAATFDDIDNTTLYVTMNTGEVKARRSTTWRFYDFFWRLHIMDYDDGENFNNNLLRAASILAIFVAISGLTLLFIKMRRLILLRRARRQESPSP